MDSTVSGHNDARRQFDISPHSPLYIYSATENASFLIAVQYYLGCSSVNDFLPSAVGLLHSYRSLASDFQFSFRSLRLLFFFYEIDLIVLFAAGVNITIPLIKNCLADVVHMTTNL